MYFEHTEIWGWHHPASTILIPMQFEHAYPTNNQILRCFFNSFRRLPSIEQTIWQIGSCSSGACWSTWRPQKRGEFQYESANVTPSTNSDNKLLTDCKAWSSISAPLQSTFTLKSGGLNQIRTTERQWKVARIMKLINRQSDLFRPFALTSTEESLECTHTFIHSDRSKVYHTASTPNCMSTCIAVVPPRSNIVVIALKMRRSQ